MVLLLEGPVLFCFFWVEGTSLIFLCSLNSGFHLLGAMGILQVHSLSPNLTFERRLILTSSIIRSMEPGLRYSPVLASVSGTQVKRGGKLVVRGWEACESWFYPVLC
jgi:hypothetical protein